MRVLMITSEWPSVETPNAVPFVVRQVEFLRRAGIDVDVFHFRGARNPLNYFFNWIKFRRQMFSKKYDIIHAQWGQSGIMALPKRLPLVVTFRGDDLEGIVGKNGKYTIAGNILRLVSQTVAFFADEVIVVSLNLAKKLRGRSYNLIPSGLDLTLFCQQDKLAARRILNLPEDEKIILFGGNPLEPKKRFSLAQEAVVMIEEHFPGIRLIPAQGINHIKMPIYMNASDVLLLVSYHEGSPNVVKEALACNLPVVSTDVGDVRERIGDVNGCILCENDRPETIAMALSNVLNKGERIDGRQKVLDLDENILIQKLISVYEKAISEH
jgi:teichuronic acid biosynthesis glycosyltransferase TuaC